jgi:hypothetical protein
MKRIVAALCGVLLVSATAYGQAPPPPAHVRVILDTSQSMRKLDIPRLALTATSLLYDLARPSLGPQGSFEVITFHPTFVWTDLTTAPTAVGPRIKPGAARSEREGLQRQLFGLGYDARMTYFYPGLNAAIDDLERAPGGRDARRVIVVVTDGMPDRNEERAFLENLKERFANPAAPMQLYILAFGPNATTGPATSFFSGLTRSPNGRQIGEVFTDEVGDKLPRHMIDIFGRSFGYRASDAAPGQQLGLDDGAAERVAIVAMGPARQAPSFEVAAPAGKRFNNPEGLLQTADTRGGRSYALRWLLAPHQVGEGSIDLAAAVGATFIVIRPVVLNREFARIRGSGEMVAMAGQPIGDWVLRVREIDKDPCLFPSCDLRVSFEVYVPAEGTPRNAPFSEAAFTRLAPVPPEAGDGVSDGQSRFRDYDLRRVVVPSQAKESFTAYLEAKILRNDVVIASIPPENTPLPVYPYFQFAASPVQLPVERNGRRGAIGRSQSGWCTQPFKFTSRGEPIEGPFNVRATLAGQLPQSLELMLDGVRIDDSSVPAQQQSDWAAGRPHSLDDVRGEHQFCVVSGRHTVSGPANLKVAFSLANPPYDRLPVFENDVDVSLEMASPTFWERFAGLIILLLTALAILMALLRLRFHPTLPNDLRVVAAGVGSLGRPSWFARVVGRGWLPLFASRQAKALGHLEPSDETLFRFRPAPGSTLRAVESTPEPGRRGAGDSELAVQRPYQISNGDSVHDVHVEYE